MLDGNYDSSTLDSNVALLVQHLKQTDEMAALQTHPTISTEEYTSKLKIWTESTSTSPSGLHLGHYKALIARHKYSEADPEDAESSAKQTEWNRMQETLMNLHVKILNYALERGYTYRRWHTVANTILFKDKDNVRIQVNYMAINIALTWKGSTDVRWKMRWYLYLGTNSSS